MTEKNPSPTNSSCKVSRRTVVSGIVSGVTAAVSGCIGGDNSVGQFGAEETPDTIAPEPPFVDVEVDDVAGQLHVTLSREGFNAAEDGYPRAKLKTNDREETLAFPPYTETETRSFNIYPWADERPWYDGAICHGPTYITLLSDFDEELGHTSRRIESKLAYNGYDTFDPRFYTWRNAIDPEEARPAVDNRWSRIGDPPEGGIEVHVDLESRLSGASVIESYEAGTGTSRTDFITWGTTGDTGETDAITSGEDSRLVVTYTASNTGIGEEPAPPRTNEEVTKELHLKGEATNTDRTLRFTFEHGDEIVHLKARGPDAKIHHMKYAAGTTVVDVELLDP